MRSSVRISLALLIALAFSTSSPAQTVDDRIALHASSGPWLADLATAFSPAPAWSDRAGQDADPGAASDAAAERFTFEAANAPESSLNPDGRLRLVVSRWSTDDERDRVFSAVADSGSDTLLDALRGAGGVGSLQWPGGLEYTLRYARTTARPEGGADVVLVADRSVWLWWDEEGYTPSPFTVIQLRLDPEGKGDGRLSFGTTVASDKEAGIVLGEDTQHRVLLNDGRRD